MQKKTTKKKSKVTQDHKSVDIFIVFITFAITSRLESDFMIVLANTNASYLKST